MNLVLPLSLGPPAVWGAFALWYRLPVHVARKVFGLSLWTAFSLSMLLALGHGHIAVGMAGFILAFAGLLVWWMQILPTNDGVWAEDVARMTSGVVDGTRVTLHNVRNFDWRSQNDFTPRWESRTYELDELRAVDMVMSYWRGPAIAHMLISFGFENASQVVFSVEVRRQKTQQFSEIGGFFKEFELSIIAADERDVIRLRTNVRGEDVYIYRLLLPPTAARSLFLGYVAEANGLIRTPRFYNTLTVNCTMLVYQMMKRIVGRLPFDYRLLLSGYLPEYVYSVGGLDQHHSLDELRRRGRITERAKACARSANFSAEIRHGL